MGALPAQATPPIVYPSIDWWELSPLIVLLGGGLLLLVLGALTPPWPRHLYATFAALVSAAAGALGFMLFDDVTDDGAHTIIRGTLAVDHVTQFATIAVAVSVILVIFLADDYLRREGLDGPEVYGLLLMAALGALVMIAANDLVVLFLGLETLSISFYVLAASHRHRSESQEAGLKYFVLGGFASVFFLYGVALIYGATTSTNLTTISDVLTAEINTGTDDALLLAGVALLIVGLAFKVSAVPFHVWTPDVYHGAPTPVTAFMASVGKIAAFTALIRVLVVGLPSRADDWGPLIWVLAIASIVIGSILAIVQTNVKRMLAYSSVAHAGYILVGVEVASHVGTENSGVSSSMIYLLLYAVIVIGSFAVVTVIARSGDTSTELADFRGVAREKPVLALAFTVLLLAQAGVPLTSGFIAKFGVIAAADEVESYALAIIAMAAAVIGAYAYLRIVMQMWFVPEEGGDEAREPLRIPLGIGVLLFLAVGFTLLVGVFPDWLLNVGDDLLPLARVPLTPG